jgi:hypothetical protein
MKFQTRVIVKVFNQIQTLILGTQIPAFLAAAAALNISPSFLASCAEGDMNALKILLKQIILDIKSYKRIK